MTIRTTITDERVRQIVDEVNAEHGVAFRLEPPKAPTRLEELEEQRDAARRALVHVEGEVKRLQDLHRKLQIELRDLWRERSSLKERLDAIAPPALEADLVEDLIALVHPDRHPAARFAVANRTLQRVLKLRKS